MHHFYDNNFTLRCDAHASLWTRWFMLSDVAYTLKPPEGGSTQLQYDAKDNWRPHGFRNTISEKVYAGRQHTTFTQQSCVFSDETQVYISRLTSTCMAASSWALRRGCDQQYSTSGEITCNDKTRFVVFNRKVNAHVYVPKCWLLLWFRSCKTTFHMVTDFCSRMALGHTRQMLQNSPLLKTTSLR